MTDISREATLRKVASDYDATGRTGPLDWNDIGLLCEGLAFAQRPLRQGTGQVTKQYNLGPRGAHILNLLANGVLHPLELATALCCGRSLITAELARLTDAGLVTSRPGQVDRRRTELSLTPLGERTSQQIREDTSRILLANLAGYTPEEVRKLAFMLRVVRGEGMIDEEAESAAA